MRRRLFNFAAAVSLALCVGTVVLWVRSYRYVDRAGVHRSTTTCSLTSYKGAIHAACIIQFNDDPPLKLGCFANCHALTATYPICYPDPQFCGCGASYEDSAYSPNLDWHIATRQVTIPDWFLVIVLLSPLIRFGVVRFRRVRRLHGHKCFTCGYSLTGNTSGTCPECGTPATEKAGAKA